MNHLEKATGGSLLRNPGPLDGTRLSLAENLPDPPSKDTGLSFFTREIHGATGHHGNTIISPPLRVLVGLGSAAVLTIWPADHLPLTSTAPAATAPHVMTARNQPTRTASSPYQEALRWIYCATGLSKERVGNLVGVTRQTIANWENGGVISDKGRRRLLLVHDVLRGAHRYYPAADDLAAWLDTPRGARGLTPAELIRGSDYRQARLFAMATPSLGVKAAGDWTRQVASAGFDRGAEHSMEALPPDQDYGYGHEDADEGDVFVARITPGEDDPA